MNQLSTNVLIIGRSGVGKSSLLNYLFNKEIQKTGTGKPTTAKGVFPFDYQYDENFKICIYDTWGLEPDKSGDWEKLIIDEVAKHDKQHVSEWFNTIIYCLSANSDRVEDFEVKIIKSLVDTNNQMVIAITHCERNNDPRADVMRKSVISLAGVKQEQVVLVSNVEKKLIGKSVEKFGREEVFTVIIRNLWESLKEKVPFNIKQQMDNAFSEERKKFHNTISNQWFLFQRDKKLDEFEKNVNEEFSKFISKEMDNINSRFIEAMDYYNALSKQYMEIGLINKESIMNMPEMHFEALKEFKKEVEEQVQAIRDNLGDIVTLLNEDISKEFLQKFCMAIKKYFSSSKEIKESLNRTVDNYFSNAENITYIQIEKIKEQLQKINIEQIGMLMLLEK